MQVLSSHQAKKLCSQWVNRRTRLLFAGLLTVSFLTATGQQAGRHVEQQSYVKATLERGWWQIQRRLELDPEKAASDNDRSVRSPLRSRCSEPRERSVVLTRPGQPLSKQRFDAWSEAGAVIGIRRAFNGLGLSGIGVYGLGQAAEPQSADHGQCNL